MTSTNFCYWLRGARELCKLNSPNEEKTKMILDHLKLVSFDQDREKNEFCHWLWIQLSGKNIHWEKIWKRLDVLFVGIC